MMLTGKKERGCHKRVDPGGGLSRRTYGLRPLLANFCWCVCEMVMVLAA